jgi:hypothetical protein
LLGKGDGTFQPQMIYFVGRDPIFLISGDFNNDTKIDLIVANRGDNTIGLLFGNGNGTFMTQISYTVGSDPTSLISGDFNGDGRLDLGVVNALGDDVAIFLNQCG